MRKTLYQRVKNDNTMHKYPYGIRDFIENTNEHGLASALHEDWYMTKERARDGLGDLLERALYFVGVTVAIPILAYSGFRMVKQLASKKTKGLR